MNVVKRNYQCYPSESALLSFHQLFFYSVPCSCFGSIPLWHCIPTCFQVPIVKQMEVSPSFPRASISHGENHAVQQQVQLQPQKRYISGDSYQKLYSLSHDFNQFNDPNLLQPQHQQQQQHEGDDEYWQPDQHSDEPIIYIAETTPNPYNKLIDTTKLVSIQPQPESIANQYDDGYLIEALNDIPNHTTSMHPSPISAIGSIFQTSKGKLQWASFNVLKRQKMHSSKDEFRRNYPIKRAAFPSAVCNSKRLRRVILQAITADVSKSKRSVTEAAEHAYQGIKFDVICAQGDFSYTIHAKKYCEVTKENTTCFAFR
uniref:Ground-like domain-containing protein n=1 Tax=Elaeophora elaphi TaxID=1147741 RepID=A0A0R3RTR4_9BILA